MRGWLVIALDRRAARRRRHRDRRPARAGPRPRSRASSPTSGAPDLGIVNVPPPSKASRTDHTAQTSRVCPTSPTSGAVECSSPSIQCARDRRSGRARRLRRSGTVDPARARSSPGATPIPRRADEATDQLRAGPKTEHLRRRRRPTAAPRAAGSGRLGRRRADQPARRRHRRHAARVPAAGRDRRRRPRGRRARSRGHIRTSERSAITALRLRDAAHSTIPVVEAALRRATHGAPDADLSSWRAANANTERSINLQAIALWILAGAARHSRRCSSLLQLLSRQSALESDDYPVAARLGHDAARSCGCVGMTAQRR